MKLLRLSALTLLALLLQGGGCNNPEPSTDPVPVAPSTLCVDSGCGTKTRLLAIPDAENLLFTPEGRLFVSGGSNVYEVTFADAAWHARSLVPGSCNFTGLALRNDVLYAACGGDRRLYAAVLTAAPQLQPIHQFENMALPNGMVTGPDGEIYVVDGPLSGSALPSPKIVRLLFDSANPLAVTRQETWLGTGLQFPNGITRRERTLYVTDGSTLPPTTGLVRAIEIQPDGSPGTPQDVVTFASVLDDLSVAGDHLLVSLFTNGRIALAGLDGTIPQQTAIGSFDNPSAVRLGTPPMFRPDDILVTEKGPLGESGSEVGNFLSLFRRNQ